MDESTNNQKPIFFKWSPAPLTDNNNEPYEMEDQLIGF